MSYNQSRRVIKVGAFDRRWAFVASQNFHSIMIVVPLHVSKSSRVLKKLTPESELRKHIESGHTFERISLIVEGQARVSISLDSINKTRHKPKWVARSSAVM
jgi:hypothetical protein